MVEGKRASGDSLTVTRAHLCLLETDSDLWDQLPAVSARHARTCLTNHPAPICTSDLRAPTTSPTALRASVCNAVGLSLALPENMAAPCHRFSGRREAGQVQPRACRGVTDIPLWPPATYSLGPSSRHRPIASREVPRNACFPSVFWREG
jgi:hypothetical protein